jgi:hypothetical protein
MVRRFRCSGCRKTFTVLPPSLLPFKHYAAQEIEQVLRHLFDGGKLLESPSGAEERTLRRWWREFSYRLGQWAGALESTVFAFSRQVPSLIRHARSHPLRRLEEVLSRLPPLPSRWTLMVKSLWHLERPHQLRLPRPP